MPLRLWRFASAPAVLLIPLLLPAQHMAAPDEVRVSSQPYVPQPYTFRAESSLVEVEAVVRDGHGRAVGALTRDNFRVLDEGKQQEIASFSRSDPETAAPRGGDARAATPASAATAPAASEPVARPRFLALLFDDINMAYGQEAADIHRAQAAAVKFVRTSLRPGDQAGIFTVSGSVTQDFTADHEKLTEAIGAVKAHAKYADQVCAGMSPYQAYRIAKMNDRETIRLLLVAAVQHNCPTSTNAAMVRATEVWDTVKANSLTTLATIAKVVHYLGGKNGDRVLLLASTGFVGQTMEREQDGVIGEAVHVGVVINSLVTKGLFSDEMAGERFEDPAPQKAFYQMLPRYQAWAKAENAEVDERPMVMDDAMGYLAQGTGGVFFHNNNDLNAGFRQTSVAPEATYRLAFYPKAGSADSGYHRLRVELAKTKSYFVEARPGYFARAEATDNLRSQLDAAVMGTKLQSGVDANVSLSVQTRADGTKALLVRTHVDIARMPFTTADGRQNDSLTVVTALFDAQGKIVAAKEGKLDLSLKPDTRDRIAATGINADLTLLAPPSEYQLRAVVQEAAKGNLTAATYPVEIK